MKNKSDYDILVEALLTEMPHIKVGGDNEYEDLHIEDILGDVDALKHKLKALLLKYPNRTEIAQRLRNNYTLLLIVKKHFGLKLAEYVHILKDILTEIMDKPVQDETR